MATKDEPIVTAESLLDDGSAPRPPSEDLMAALTDVGDGEVRLHPVLSNVEFRAAEAKALARIDKEDKAAAMKAVEEEMIEKIRGKKGMLTGNAIMDEMVEIHLDLAEFAADIRINGVIYPHGGTFTVPRHVANTMREIQSRGHIHQNELDGKGIADRYRLPYNTLIDKRGVHNAPPAAA